MHLEARVDEPIDPRRLADAILAATRVHPIARARLQYYEYGDTSNLWEIPDELDHVPPTEITLTDDDQLPAVRSRLQSIQVPLSASPPLLVYLVHAPGGDWLMLNVNHVVGDDLSTFRILTSIVPGVCQ